MLYWSKITRKPQHATRVVLHAFLFGWICVADAATEVASVAQHLLYLSTWRACLSSFSASAGIRAPTKVQGYHEIS